MTLLQFPRNPLLFLLQHESSSIALAIQGYPVVSLQLALIRETLCTAEPSLPPVLTAHLSWDGHRWASPSVLTYTELFHTTLSFPLVFII